jgi:hypothetical protein
MKRLWLFFFPFFACFAEVKICLVITVEETQNLGLRDCLRSAQNLVDAVCIIDQTSKDWVKIDVHDFLIETDILGFVCPFEKGGKNSKFMSIQTAKKMLQELGFSLEETYLLLLDPDMSLQIREGFNKNQLGQDAYLILQKSPDLSYCTYRPRLLRASRDWQCDNFLHEIWLPDQRFASEKLRTLTIEGGNALYEIPLLEEALEKNPGKNC